MFNFENLDARTRELMLLESDFDVEQSNLYVHPRLAAGSEAKYFLLLKEALHSGSPESFAAAINANSILKNVELRTTGGRQSVVKIPTTAAQLLAEAEFNRYYMRAICLRAKEVGSHEVEVYRAKPVKMARGSSDGLIGKRFNSETLLADLRKSNLDVESESGLARPNSGLSIRLPQEK